MQVSSEFSPSDVELVTCSMATDLEPFSLLCRSMDACCDSRYVHHVIVPRKDIACFQQFSSMRRRIIAQEALLPRKLFALPDFFKLLSFVSQGFRRPIYFDSKMRAIRGWIIQQLLKLEFAKNSTAKAVIHIDSDVCFFRDLNLNYIFPDRKPLFFTARRVHDMATHNDWENATKSLLGLQSSSVLQTHHVENCIVWCPGVARRLLNHIEEIANSPYYEAIVNHSRFSEYELYGNYLELVEGTQVVSARDYSLCNTVWSGLPQNEYFPFLAKRMAPQHCALGVQSTIDLPFEERLALYEAVRSAFEK